MARRALLVYKGDTPVMRRSIARKQLILLGKRIRQKRLALGLSQEELAASAEIHPTYLSALECGKRNASLGVLFSVADALSVGASELLDPKGESGTEGRHGKGKRH
jgi:transcriptional regulator with XRE-family HTH domain